MREEGDQKERRGRHRVRHEPGTEARRAREALRKLVDGYVFDLYHLERLSSLLNTPKHYGIRAEYLEIDMNREEVIAYLSVPEGGEHYKRLEAISERLRPTDEGSHRLRDRRGQRRVVPAGSNPNGKTTLDIGKKVLRLHAVGSAETIRSSTFELSFRSAACWATLSRMSDGFRRTCCTHRRTRYSLVEGPPEVVYQVGEATHYYFVINFQTRNKAYFQHLHAAVSGGRCRYTRCGPTRPVCSSMESSIESVTSAIPFRLRSQEPARAL